MWKLGTRICKWGNCPRTGEVWELHKAKVYCRYLWFMLSPQVCTEMQTKWPQTFILTSDSYRNSVISPSCQNMPCSLLLNTLPVTRRVVWYPPHLSYCESEFIEKYLQDHPFVATHCQGSLRARRRNTLWLFTLPLYFPHFPLQQFRGSKLAEQGSLGLHLAPLQFFCSGKV